MRILAFFGCYALIQMTDTIRTALNSWRQQQGDFDIDVLVSSNLCSDMFREQLYIEFISQTSKRCRFHDIQTDCELTVFNAINLCYYQYKNHKIDFYIYSHEDVILSGEKDLWNLIQEFQDTMVGTVFAWVDKKNATAYSKFRDISAFNIAGGKPLEIDLDDTPAMTFVIFSNKVMSRYNYRFIDKIRSAGADGYCSLIAHVLGLRTVISTRCMLVHDRHNSKYTAKTKITRRRYGIKTYDLLGCDWESLLNKGRGVGFYFATKQTDLKFPEYRLDRSLIDKEGLYCFIVRELFLSNSEFDYSTVSCKIISSKANKHD